jgi:hypothetical protein
MHVTSQSETRMQTLTANLASRPRTVENFWAIAERAALIGVLCIFWGVVLFTALGSLQ